MRFRAGKVAVVKSMRLMAVLRSGLQQVQAASQSARQVSSMRLEKPHSLSYQAITFSRRPLTLVWLVSNMDDMGLWLKSQETSGRELHARTAERRLASSIRALTSSALVSRLSSRVRSTSETLITGTRTAM